MSQASWPEAQNYCRSMYTDLAIVITSADWLRLNKEIASTGLTSRAWIGFYNDVDSWRWSLNDFLLKDATLTNWYPGQPDNYGGHQSCGTMAINGYWYDQCCTDTRPVICFN
ncbi:macrophage mannose receptor 1-like isoform X6, partial [Clarias magur]